VALEDCVFDAVAFEFSGASVVGAAVEFDHEAGVGPVEVDILAVEDGVDEWFRDAGIVEFSEEVSFEARAGGRWWAVGGEGFVEPLHALSSRGAGDRLVDRGEVEQVPAL
jgi:hypothetical protein